MNLASIPKLTELVCDPGRVQDLQPEAIPAIRGELARLDTLLLSQLLQPGNRQGRNQEDGDRLLNAHEAAEKLAASTDYLYRHSSKLPFTVRLGRKVRFSEAGIERYIRARMGR